ncbi:PorP/SprF family type IX secretion system membrane protein [Bacteroidota bacterium]
MRGHYHVFLFAVGILLACSFTAGAQDQHHSMPWQNPTYTNPAFTGKMRGNYRLTFLHRRQWGFVNSIYQSNAFSFDMNLGKEKWRKRYIGVGVSYYGDKAGDLNFGKNTGNIHIAYSFQINKNNDLSGGLSAGFSRYNLNLGNAQWDNQWTINVNTDGNTDYSSYNAMQMGNVSLGLVWTYFTKEKNLSDDQKFLLQVGASYSNLILVNQKSYFQPQKDQYRRLNAHIEAFIAPDGLGGSAIIPNIFFSWQGPSIEGIAGLRYRYRFQNGQLAWKYSQAGKANKILRESALSFGGYYRLEGAVTIQAGLEIRNFGLSVGYDINVMQSKFDSNFNSFEIALSYVIGLETGRTGWDTPIYKLNKVRAL